MGVSLSSNRRRHHHNNNYYPNPPSQLISSSSPPYPPPYDLHPAAGAPQPPPPPPPPPGYYYPAGGYAPNNYANPLMGRPNFGPYYDYHNNHGWIPIRPMPMAALPPPPPPPTYVEHQQAKKVRNDVNVHKDTLKLEPDEDNPDHHLVSFVFDALFDGSITIFYFAKEEMDCKFVPLYPESYVPVRVPFQKGPGQNFRQPSGTGFDLGFFALDDLSKPSPGEDVFPLVISAETCLPPPSTSSSIDDLPPNASPHMQITQATLEKNNDDHFKVKVIKQILWIDGVRYELREIYGIGNSAESVDDSDSGSECIICLTEPKNTAALPCRHMCMCSECAKALRLQSNKCPICRQHIEELMEIKINSNVDQ